MLPTTTQGVIESSEIKENCLYNLSIKEEFVMDVVDMKFSERQGFITKTLQTDRVDKELRNKLWNLFVKTTEIRRSYSDLTQDKVIRRGRILRLIWSEGLNKLVDEFPKEPWLIAFYSKFPSNL